MTKILLLHGSREGHTVKICNFIAQQLEQHDLFANTTGLGVQQLEISTLALADVVTDNTTQFDLASFDVVVIGASIHYGHFPKALLEFVSKYHQELASKPSYFFGVNLTARKPEKRTVATNVYVRKFLQRSRWQPTQAFVFAGALNYSQLNWFDRTMIRFIMWLTKGDTDPATNKVYTDWQEVRKLVDAVAQNFQPQKLAS